jgi:hypothetical protein
MMWDTKQKAISAIGMLRQCVRRAKASMSFGKDNASESESSEGYSSGSSRRSFLRKLGVSAIAAPLAAESLTKPIEDDTVPEGAEHIRSMTKHEWREMYIDVSQA